MTGNNMILATLVVAGGLADAAPAHAQAAPAPYAWAHDLLLDHRARRSGDLVTVQITESIAASGSADSNLGKASQSDGKLPWPIPSKFSQALQSSSDTKFTGTGTTSARPRSPRPECAVTERRPTGTSPSKGRGDCH
jgi:hypothetical protein